MIWLIFHAVLATARKGLRILPMIRFACPTCQKAHKAPEKAAGRKVHCLRCSQLIIVPVPVEIKNKPLVGLLLPEAGPESPPLPSEDSIDHSFDDCVTLSDSLPLDPPPVRQPPAPETRVLLENTDPFGELLPQNEERPYWVPAKHSVQGLIATVGAVVMFLLVLLFFNVNWPPIPALSKISLATKLTGGSCATIGLAWSVLSFMAKNKRFWSIVGCVANLALLLLSIFIK